DDHGRGRGAAHPDPRRVHVVPALHRALRHAVGTEGLAMPDDFDRFPAAIYRDTVLAPLFEASKHHHAAALFRIHYAHGIMLAEQGIVPRPEMDRILAALRAIER